MSSRQMSTRSNRTSSDSSQSVPSSLNVPSPASGSGPAVPVAARQLPELAPVVTIPAGRFVSSAYILYLLCECGVL
jgi:hypothetical protein